MRAKLFGEVHLHLGAHRTGSTSFQTLLGVNYDAIRAHGIRVGFTGRGAVPNGHLDLQLGHRVFARKNHSERKRHIAETKANLAPFVRNGINQQSILSEENMLGGMASFERGALYPDVKMRMEILRKALLPSAVGNVLLLIRSYEDFFKSAFRNRAERYELPAFSKVAQVQSEFDGGWPEVVDHILNALHPKQLFVVTYSRDRDDLALLKQLCPKLDVADMKRPEAWANSSFSDGALFECQRRLHAGEALSRDASRAIRDEFADAKVDRPFAVYDPDQAAVLRERYQSDLEVLRRHTGITFVES
ncbi:hypothetical protein ALP8811_01154 [Aliiroseovarius pelagivivens]|uniref:Sulfotransferase family protein n=1 Tax=Aliiroseovarius pelagivivens TaxID=1639690 RepID=A0A2R8AJU9_9RHOB|nr:hypothetical protein [Aliiroseovarius pelagivivens]SPF76154.1 hypothetical protein ALP8811_01154 [Aliiroseovarius pelagivivens]